MIYKFKSKATGDLIMLQAHAEQMLRLIGREPSTRGIIEVDAMPAAIAALEAAIAADEPTAEDEGQEAPVALRQRLWPIVEMLRQALKASQPVVWGV